MDKYSDLEMSIISCFIQKPELIEKIKDKEDYFIRHKKLILFLQAVYRKFGTFDLNLLFEVCKEEHKLLMYVEWLAQLEPLPSNIDYYINELEELRKETKREKYIREKIYSLATDVYLKNMDVKTFADNLIRVYEDSERIKED